MGLIKLRNGVKYFVEVILDPSGLNFKFDGKYSVSSITPLEYGYDPDPAFMDEIRLQDIQIEVNDPDGMFVVNRVKGLDSSGAYDTGQYKPFNTRFTTCAYAPTATSVAIMDAFNYWHPVGFLVGDYVTIYENGNTDSFVITDIDEEALADWPYSSNTRIYYAAGSLSYAYTKYAVIYKDMILGKPIKVQLRLEDGTETYTYTLYNGVIRKSFLSGGGKAILSIDNYMKQYMNKELTIYVSSGYLTTPTKRYDSTGTLTETIAWTTQTGSGVLGNAYIYNGASLGLWVVTFSNATTFTVTGPGCNAKAGTTGVNFFDQTDATDSQIQIPAAQWSGTPAAGDVVEFYVSLNFTGTTFNACKTLLQSHAVVSSDYVDYASFANSGSYTEKTTKISFGESGTIGEALLALLPHECAHIFMSLPKTYYWSGYQTINEAKLMYHIPIMEEYWDCTGNADNAIIPGTFQKYISDAVNVFIVYYGYDHTNEQYLYRLIYPETATGNPSKQILDIENAMTIYLPGIYTEAVALTIACRYYMLYAFGQTKISFQTPVCAMLNFCLYSHIWADATIHMLMNGDTHNTDIFVIMKKYFDLESLRLTCEGYEQTNNWFGTWA